MRTLVTGATGFVGWHTAARLREAGHEVRALVRDAEKAARLLEPLGIGPEHLVIGDMTDEGAVSEALRGREAVVHCAANVAVHSDGSDEAYQANVRGTELVIGGAVSGGAGIAIFVSSLTSILEPTGPIPTVNSPLVEGATRYGQSKASSEEFVRSLEAQGAPVAIVYPPAIWGPNDPGLSEAMTGLRTFLTLTLRAPGGMQFVDVRDLAALHLRILEARAPGRYIAGGHFLDWNALTRALQEIAGARIFRLAAPGWALRLLGSLAELSGSSKARDLGMTRASMDIATGWRAVPDSPSIADLAMSWRPADESLRETLRWMLEAGHIEPGSAPRLE